MGLRRQHWDWGCQPEFLLRSLPSQSWPVIDTALPRLWINQPWAGKGLTPMWRVWNSSCCCRPGVWRAPCTRLQLYSLTKLQPQFPAYIAVYCWVWSFAWNHQSPLGTDPTPCGVLALIPALEVVACSFYSQLLAEVSSQMCWSAGPMTRLTFLTLLLSHWLCSPSAEKVPQPWAIWP